MGFRLLKKRNLLLFLFVLVVLFLFLEVATRFTVGERLITKVEDDGYYYFEPDQYGWYSHDLRTPRAKINNLGARGDDVDDIEKKKYIFLGDSFTFGWELSDDETIPYYVMDTLSLTTDDVVNYGNGGFGVEHMIRSYDHHVEYFSAGDVVVMIMVHADFYRPLGTQQPSFLKDLFWQVRKRSAFLAFLWSNYRALNPPNYVPPYVERDPYVFGDWGTTLLDFHDHVVSFDQDLVYVFYEYDETDYSHFAQDFCDEYGLTCFTSVYESADRIREQNLTFYAPDGGHPSAALNLEVAERLADFLSDEGLV